MKCLFCSRIARTATLTTMFMLAILLPAVAVGAAAVGVTGMTNTPNPMIPEQQVVDYLAQKNISYWFISLAVVAITSWSFIVRWLLKQLELQRTASSDTQKQLIDYMQKDHTAMVQVVTEVSGTQKKTVEVLERVLDKLK